jgi:hypothetical protein
MNAKLKMQRGTHFASKMDVMLNDLAVGSEQCNEFEPRMRQFDTKLDFGVQLSSVDHWILGPRKRVWKSRSLRKCFAAWRYSKSLVQHAQDPHPHGLPACPPQ